METSRKISFVTLLIFLVICFAVANNQSTLKKFTLRPVKQEIYNKEVINLLDGLKTIETNKIRFDKYDVKLLTEICSTPQCVTDKPRAIETYNKKVTALNCVNALIVTNIFLKLGNTNLINGKLSNGDKKMLEKFKTHTARMLSLLYYGRFLAASWNIMVYVQLVIAVDSDTFGQLAVKDIFSYGQMLEYLKYCQKVELIPLQNSYASLDAYVETIDIDKITKQLYDNAKLTKTAYKFVSLFNAENLTLSHLFAQRDDIFDKTVVVKLISLKTHNVMTNYVDKLSALSKTHQWHFMVYENMRCYLQFQHIVYTNVLYQAWFHLKCYQVLVDDQYLINKFMNYFKDPMKYWSLITKPLEEAIRILDINDSIFITVLQMFQNDKKVDSDDLRDLVQRVSAVLTVCLNDIDTDKLHDILQIFKSGTKENKSNYVKEMKENVTALITFNSIIKNALRPINNNMFFIKFIASGIIYDFHGLFLPYYNEYEY